MTYQLLRATSSCYLLEREGERYFLDLRIRMEGLDWVNRLLKPEPVLLKGDLYLDMHPTWVLRGFRSQDPGHTQILWRVYAVRGFIS